MIRTGFVMMVAGFALCAACTPAYRFIAGPVPTPPPPVTPSVTSVNLSATGATASVTVSEASYAGPFTAQTSNASIVTIGGAAQANTFTLTAGSTPGTATVTISGQPGAVPATISVVVTITQGVVQ